LFAATRGMMKIFSRILVTAFLMVPFAASAEDTATKTAPPAAADTAKPAKPTKLKQQELQVMAHYHALNQKEVELGNVAAKKATSEGVKAYGKMLVKEHGDADKKLVALAKKTGQVIPREKPADEAEKKEMADDKAAAAKLKTLKGADFEREYLRMMVQGHEKELAKLDANLARLENADLVESFKGKRETLQRHADEARKLQTNEATSMHDHDASGSTPTTATR
jgi:putative membrane protein